MAKYKNYDGDGNSSKSYVKGLILIFVGAVAILFGLVGIVFGTTIIFASQSISDSDIMSEYKYNYACYNSTHTKQVQYATESNCKAGNSTYYWGQDVAGGETDAYLSWQNTNKTVADGTETLVKAVSFALAFVGLIFFILGISNTGLFNIGTKT